MPKTIESLAVTCVLYFEFIIQSKRGGTLSPGSFFFMTMLGRILQLQQRDSCSVFDGFLSPPYSLDVPPFDFHLFPHMKRCLRGQHFGTDTELQITVENWLKALAAGFHDEGIGKLVPRHEKCLRQGGDYLESRR